MKEVHHAELTRFIQMFSVSSLCQLEPWATRSLSSQVTYWRMPWLHVKETYFEIQCNFVITLLVTALFHLNAHTRWTPVFSNKNEL